MKKKITILMVWFLVFSIMPCNVWAEALFTDQVNEVTVLEAEENETAFVEIFDDGDIPEEQFSAGVENTQISEETGNFKNDINFEDVVDVENEAVFTVEENGVETASVEWDTEIESIFIKPMQESFTVEDALNEKLRPEVIVNYITGETETILPEQWNLIFSPWQDSDAGNSKCGLHYQLSSGRYIEVYVNSSEGTIDFPGTSGVVFGNETELVVKTDWSFEKQIICTYPIKIEDTLQNIPAIEADQKVPFQTNDIICFQFKPKEDGKYKLDEPKNGENFTCDVVSLYEKNEKYIKCLGNSSSGTLYLEKEKNYVLVVKKYSMNEIAQGEVTIISKLSNMSIQMRKQKLTVDDVIREGVYPQVTLYYPSGKTRIVQAREYDWGLGLREGDYVQSLVNYDVHTGETVIAYLKTDTGYLDYPTGETGTIPIGDVTVIIRAFDQFGELLCEKSQEIEIMDWQEYGGSVQWFEEYQNYYAYYDAPEYQYIEFQPRKDGIYLMTSGMPEESGEVDSVYVFQKTKQAWIGFGKNLDSRSKYEMKAGENYVLLVRKAESQEKAKGDVRIWEGKEIIDLEIDFKEYLVPDEFHTGVNAYPIIYAKITYEDGSVDYYAGNEAISGEIDVYGKWTEHIVRVCETSYGEVVWLKLYKDGKTIDWPKKNAQDIPIGNLTVKAYVEGKPEFFDVKTFRVEIAGDAETLPIDKSVKFKTESTRKYYSFEPTVSGDYTLSVKRSGAPFEDIVLYKKENNYLKYVQKMSVKKLDKLIVDLTAGDTYVLALYQDFYDDREDEDEPVMGGTVLLEMGAEGSGKTTSLSVESLKNCTWENAWQELRPTVSVSYEQGCATIIKPADWKKVVVRKGEKQYRCLYYALPNGDKIYAKLYHNGKWKNFPYEGIHEDEEEKALYGDVTINVSVKSGNVQDVDIETVIGSICTKNHIFSNYVSDHNYTCTEDGTKTAKCENCFVTDTIVDENSRTGHTFLNYVSDNNQTCVKNGTKTAKCENCSATDTVIAENSRSEHAWKSWELVIESDCTKDGICERECRVCGYKENKTVMAHGHSYGEEITEDATEEKDGRVYKKCRHCKHEHRLKILVRKEEHRKIENLAQHVSGSDAAQAVETVQNIDNQAMIDTEGTKEILDNLEVKIINNKETDNVPMVGESVIDTAQSTADGNLRVEGAAITAAAVIQEKAEELENTETYHAQLSVIHTETDEVSEKKRYQVDIRVNIVNSQNECVAENVELKAPIWITMTKPAMFAGESFELYHIVNGEYHLIPYMENKENNTILFAAPSLSPYVFMSSCEAGTHGTMINKTVVRPAACQEVGLIEGVCEICGTKITEIIPEEGHDCEEKVLKEPDCLNNGLKALVCKKNPAHIVEKTIILATGHIWETEVTVDKKASCITKGMESIHCSCCDVVKEDTVTITEGTHEWSKWERTSKATVFAKEKQKRTCNICKKTETREKGEKVTPILKTTVSSLTLKTKQKTTKFKVTMAAGDTVKKWKSSDTNVFTVSGKSDGTSTITAKNKGSAKLTITLKSGKKATVKVTVQSKDVKTTKIKNVTDEVILEEGKTKTLKPTLEPFTSTEKITYSSSNSKIAEVSSKGKITAVSPGTAKITVKSGSKTAECKVTVPGIANIKSKITVKKGKTYTLSPKCYGLTGTTTYESSNTKVAKVSSKGKITAIAPGTVKITVKRGDKSVTCKVTVPGITNVKSEIIVKKGKTYTLSPKLYGVKDTVSYKSSDKKIAKVSSKGEITAKKKGTAIVTIKAGDYTVKCKIIVK